jgi:hypothetical protein
MASVIAIWVWYIGGIRITGEKKHLHKTCTGVKFSIANFAWTGLFSNPAIRSDRLANNLKHGMTLAPYSWIDHYIHRLWLKTFAISFRKKITALFWIKFGVPKINYFEWFNLPFARTDNIHPSQLEPCDVPQRRCSILYTSWWDRSHFSSLIV